jgi:hypothetical protein
MGALFVAAASVQAAKFTNGHAIADLKAMATSCACMAQIGALMASYYGEGVKVYSEEHLKEWLPDMQRQSSAMYRIIRTKLLELNRLSEALDPHPAIRTLLKDENAS